MKHGREDYNRIQDPAGTIGEDEPVFLLRGKDRLAVHNLYDYAARCEESGLPEMAAQVRAWALKMKAWQEINGCELPDLPVEVKPAKVSGAKER